MTKTNLKNKVSIKNIISVIGLGLVCSVSLIFFGYQIFNSIVLTGSETINKGITCNAPLPIGSNFYQQWPLGNIGCAWPAFYMTNGYNNESNGIITMSKETNYIKDLAEQIDTLGTPHDTVQNIMNWMHDPNHGNIQGPGSPNCAHIEMTRLTYMPRFSHTANQILSTKCALSCQEWALSFVALARAKGIPASSLETVSDRWITESKNAGCLKQPKLGHVIADVYTGVTQNGGWELVDPTVGHFTVYEDNDFAGFALMRFNVYEPGSSLVSFGSGYRYRVFHRGIDSWDYGMTSDEVWTQAVIAEYGLPSTYCANKDDKSIETPDWLWWGNN